MDSVPRDPGGCPPLPGGPRARGWRDPAFVPEEGRDDPGALLDHLFDLAPEAMLRRVPGRETFRWPGRPELVVKRTWGGEARDWWYELLRPEAPRSPGRRECENLLALAADGLRVPRALAWVEERGAARHPLLGGRGRRSAVVMERVPHVETVRYRLARATPGEVRELGEVVSDIVARLHGAGWYHRDLYLQHFVLPDGTDAGAEPVLLDVGRARRERAPRERWFVKDLAALLHSAPDNVSRDEARAFLGRWLAARGITGARAQRRWAHAVRRKERRLAAHAPRHVDAAGQGAR